MKCTECGKNIAVYHYVSNINGDVTESHLCEECARKAKDNGGLSAMESFDRLMEESFNDFFQIPFMRNLARQGRLGDDFFGSGMLDRFFDEDYSFIPVMGAMMLPGFFRTGKPVGGNNEKLNEDHKVPNEASEEKTAKKNNIDEAIVRRREIISLKEQMHKAARAEDYETAAKLRDQIKSLENRAE